MYQKVYQALTKEIFKPPTQTPQIGQKTDIVLALATQTTKEASIFNNQWECTATIENQQNSCISLDQNSIKRLCLLTNIHPNSVQLRINQLYETGQVETAKPGHGILETFTITSNTGKTFMVASDSGCTSPLILQEAIS